MNITEFIARCRYQEAIVVGDSNYLLTISCTYPDGTDKIIPCGFYFKNNEEFCLKNIDH